MNTVEASDDSTTHRKARGKRLVDPAVTARVVRLIASLPAADAVKVRRLADAFIDGKVRPAEIDRVSAGLSPADAVDAVDRLLDDVGA